MANGMKTRHETVLEWDWGTNHMLHKIRTDLMFSCRPWVMASLNGMPDLTNGSVPMLESVRAVSHGKGTAGTIHIQFANGDHGSSEAEPVRKKFQELKSAWRAEGLWDTDFVPKHSTDTVTLKFDLRRNERSFIDAALRRVLRMLNDMGFEKRHLQSLRIYRETFVKTDSTERHPDGWMAFGEHVASRINPETGALGPGPDSEGFDPDEVVC